MNTLSAQCFSKFCTPHLKTVDPDQLASDDHEYEVKEHTSFWSRKFWPLILPFKPEKQLDISDIKTAR